MAVHTLAQSRTIYSPQKPVTILNGSGTELSNLQQNKNKAKRKTITQTIMLALIDIAKEHKHFELMQSYWNTYHCQSHIQSYNKKTFGKYCKNRHCTHCCAIRKANIINRYYPILKNWNDAYFVTLTSRAVKAHNLKRNIDGTLRAFRKIKDRFRKRNERGNGFNLVGIKSLECNFNATKKTYNPHLHLIVQTEEMANLLIDEWLAIWTKEHTHIVAQDKRPINDLEHCLIEIIKYGSKIFIEPDIKKKKTSKVPPKIYANALHNIFYAMKGIRIFDRFGFNLQKQMKVKNQKTFTKDYQNWHFDLKLNDWYNFETGELLTNYKCSNELDYLLQNMELNIC